MTLNVGGEGVDQEGVGLGGVGEGERLVPSCCVGACEGRLAGPQARLAAAVDASASASAAAAAAAD